MVAAKKVLLIDASSSSRIENRRYETLYETLSCSVSSSASKVLDLLVAKAKDYFEKGFDPDQSFRDFDVKTLTNLLVLDRGAAADALASFTARPGEDKLAACMFTASAIVTINDSDPHLARLMLGEILKKARNDQKFSPLAKITMLNIAETANEVQEAGLTDPALTSLGMSCLKRLSRT